MVGVQVETEVINTTVHRLFETKPNEFYLRFHDAILCKKSECAFVSEILNGVILEIIDVKGCTKIGTWGNTHEGVLASLSLHSAFHRKEYFFQKQIGKEKQSKMLSILKNPSIPKADRYDEWQEFLTNYNNCPSNQARLAALNREYKSYRFIYPTNWKPAEVESFNNYCLTQLEAHFEKIKVNQSDAYVRFANSNLEKFRKALKESSGSF